MTELPAELKELLRAETLSDLHIWQTPEEDRRWDDPFDEAAQLLETNPEACFDGCMLALDSISWQFPLIEKFLATEDSLASVSTLPALPLYCEELSGRLLISLTPLFNAGLPYQRIPDISVRGRLWLASKLMLGHFPQVQDSLELAFTLTEQAIRLAPTDVDSLLLLVALETYVSDSTQPFGFALPRAFSLAVTAEQLSYAYYRAAWRRGFSADALACYAQVLPGTSFAEDAAAEAAEVAVLLQASEPGFIIPDYSDPAQVFNYVDGSTAVSYPVDPKFRQPALDLLAKVDSLCAAAGLELPSPPD